MLTKTELEALSHLSSERLMDDLSKLVTPEERVAGSAQDLEGAENVQAMLAPHVDRCDLESFSVTTYARTAGTLEVLSPVQRSIPCEVNPCAASGAGEGLLVDGAEGRRSELEAARAEDHPIVLLTLRDGGALPAVLETKLAGAACAVVSRTVRRDDLISVHGINVDLPVLSVSNDAAEELRAVIAEHGAVRVRYRAELTVTEGTSYNVVGVIDGSDVPEETILCTAHHDTWFVGAYDNNTAIACLLELARWFAAHRPRRTLKFVVFGAEESGFTTAGDKAIYWDRGSYSYSEAHREVLEGRADGERVVGIINGDVVGYQLTHEVPASPELLPWVQAVTANIGAHLTVPEPNLGGWTGSDHLAFHTLGTPSVYIHDNQRAAAAGAAGDADAERPPYGSIYHTTTDSMASVRPAALVHGAGLYLLLTLRLDEADGLPYAPDHLRDTALRGTENLDAAGELSALLKAREVEYRDGQPSPALRDSVLELIRIVNRQVYGFQASAGLTGFGFVHKFMAISEIVTGLRAAERALAADGDLEQARRLLRAVPGAQLYDEFSPEVAAQIERMCHASEIMSRLSVFAVDLGDVFDALAASAQPEIVLAALRPHIDAAERLANGWADEFAAALRS